jgi:hypothetical protein
MTRCLGAVVAMIVHDGAADPVTEVGRALSNRQWMCAPPFTSYVAPVM